jgi:acetyl esterase/lipase
MDENDYDSIEPSRLFGPSFPPAYFVHGSLDVIVDVKFSRRAHVALEAQGVDTELVVEEANHGFDAGAKPGDRYFELVAEGFRVLARHAVQC